MNEIKFNEKKDRENFFGNYIIYDANPGQSET